MLFCHVTGFFQEIYFSLIERETSLPQTTAVGVCCADTCKEPAAIKLQGLLPIKFYILQTLNLHYFAEAVDFFHNLVVVKKKELKKKISKFLNLAV